MPYFPLKIKPDINTRATDIRRAAECTCSSNLVKEFIKFVPTSLSIALTKDSTRLNTLANKSSKKSHNSLQVKFLRHLTIFTLHTH